LVKAILLNSADDVGASGIDFESGYGSVNSFKALRAVQQGRYISGNLTQNETQTTTLSIPAGIRQVKITLCWYDQPATPNASKALTNDIDLKLINNTTNEHWQPWVLNHFPHADSLKQAAVRKRDSLNNNEQITLENPVPGNYTIQVHGYAIPFGTQAYTISWQLDTANRFTWYYPAKADNVYGGKNNTLRWASSFDNTNSGRIEYSTDGGQHWQLISDNISLSTGYYQWPAPDTFAAALLKLTAGSLSFISDTFTISSSLKASTGFNCADSFLLTWNKPTGVNRFMVYALGEKYLHPLQMTTDTNIVLSKVLSPALHYTIAPLQEHGYTGVKAYTFDYTMQGVGCYIKNFLADWMTSSTARLTIELGALYGVQKITVEKLGIDGYNFWQSIEPVTLLQYQLTDNSLQKGVNTYRLKIQRFDGSVIYSLPETVYNLKDTKYILYPNPISSTASLHIISSDPGNSSITLFSTTGQQVLHKQLVDLHEQLPLQALQKGSYFYIIRNGAKKEQTGSIIVY
jgi:hypothetical protein